MSVMLTSSMHAKYSMCNPILYFLSRREGSSLATEIFLIITISHSAWMAHFPVFGELGRSPATAMHQETYRALNPGLGVNKINFWFNRDANGGGRMIQTLLGGCK